MNKILKKILKIVLIILLVFIGFTAIKLVLAMFKTQPKDENKFTGDQLQEGNQLAKVNDNELLFLFAGVDSTGEKTGTRTDTLMLVLANKKTKNIDIISIPRDTRVYVDGYLDKINAAHSYGGMALTIKTIREFLNIDLDYYVEVSFNAVIDAVNAMGGVDIDISEDVANAMVMNPGMHTFDGEQALNYVRFRKGYANADIGRISTQQDFMVQFLKQMLKPKNILKIPHIFFATSDDIDTNVPTKEILSFAWAFKNIKSENITTHTLDGYGDTIDGVSYYIVNSDQVLQLRDSLLYDYIINE